MVAADSNAEGLAEKLKTNTITVYGGSINNTEEDLQYKLLYNLFQFDMESAYPSAIIHNNICPTTLITLVPFNNLTDLESYLISKGFELVNCSIIDLTCNRPCSQKPYPPKAFDHSE